MQNDPIVEETRKIRNRLAAKFKYDVKALGAYYQAQQIAENRVVITRRPKRIAVKPTAAKFGVSSNNRRTKNVRRRQIATVALP
jgi:hypothetical protein